MKTILKITVGILLAGTIMVVGCAALVGAGASSVSKDLDKQQNAHAITKSQLNRTSMGSSKDEVVANLGSPENAQHMEQDGLSVDGQKVTDASTNDCIYYNVKGGSLGDSYQLCFDNGKLTSKNQF